MESILRHPVPEDGIGIWWLGQASYCFKSPKGKIIFLDPYLTDSCEKGYPGHGFNRVIPPPVEPKDVAADIILCTHDHQDHFDPETLLSIPEKILRKTTIAGPRSVGSHIKKLRLPIKNFNEVFFGKETLIDGIKVTGTFALPTDDSDLYHQGFVIEFENGIKIYNTGDTGYCELLKYIKKFSPDIMIACINGNYGNLTPEEAAILTGAVQPKIVIPMHYGLFPGNTRDPKEFEKALTEKGLVKQLRQLEVMNPFVYKA